MFLFFFLHLSRVKKVYILLIVLALAIFGFLNRNKLLSKKTVVNNSVPSFSQGKLDELVVFQFGKKDTVDNSDTVNALISQLYGIKFEEKAALTDEFKEDQILVLDKIEVRFGKSYSKIEKEIEKLVEESEVILKVDPSNIIYFEAPGRVDINCKVLEKIRGTLTQDNFTIKVKSDLGKDRELYKVKDHELQLLFFKTTEKVSDINTIPGTNLDLIDIKSIY